MRHIKSISILIVTALLLSSAVTIAGASFRTLSSDREKVIEDTGTIKERSVRGFFDSKKVFVINADNPIRFFRPIKGYYPVNLDDFGDDFKVNDLRVKFTGTLDIISAFSFIGFHLLRDGYLPITLKNITRLVDEPQLEFDISIENNEFLVEEPISVTATLENLGRTPIKVCEMGLDLQTLDFFIQTPDAEEIHYIGNVGGLPSIVDLKAGEVISFTVDDITEEGMFGNGDGSYDFGVNEYKIIGKYSSGKQSNVESEDVFDGELFSKEYTFEIVEEDPEPEFYNLIIDIEGADEGCVTTVPEPGVYTYKAGEQVEITAKVLKTNTGKYKFSHWSGDASGDENPTKITIDSNKLVVAHFIKETPIFHTLTIKHVGSGGTEPGAGEHEYEEGTKVEIHVFLPFEQGVGFIGWSGDASGDECPLKIVMDSDKLIIANFNRPPNAHFVYFPKSPVVNEPVNFVSDSIDNDGNGSIVSYEWVFGDGTSLVGKESSPLHSYAAEGTYTVCLTVTDDYGASDTYCENITVTNEELGIIHGFVYTIDCPVVVDIDPDGNSSDDLPDPIPIREIPVEGATVIAKSIRNDPEDEFEFRAITDKDGFFKIENVPRGIYEINVIKEGYFSNKLPIRPWNVYPGDDAEYLFILLHPEKTEE